jgi:hypothetical protein
VAAVRVRNVCGLTVFVGRQRKIYGRYLRLTCRVTVARCVSVPELAVMVSVALPTLAVFDAVTVSFEVAVAATSTGRA